MGTETQAQIAERHLVETLASQIRGLGFTNLQNLHGISGVAFGSDSHCENWRYNVAQIRQAFQAYCFGICYQMEIEKADSARSLETAIFTLTAIRNFTLNQLKPSNIQMQVGLDQQRQYVRKVVVCIKNFCESLAEKINSETSRGGI